MDLLPNHFRDQGQYGKCSNRTDCHSKARHMKIVYSKSNGSRGSTLMLVIIATALVGFVLAAYLTLLSSQNAATIRSQAWNSSVPVVEAGIEDALAHLNRNGTNRLDIDGWS